MSKFLDKTFTEKLRKDTLVVVTFDESDHNADKTRSSRSSSENMVKEANQQDPKVLDRRYTHYNVLRTIKDNFGLEPLAAGDRDVRRLRIFGSEYLKGPLVCPAPIPALLRTGLSQSAQRTGVLVMPSRVKGLGHSLFRGGRIENQILRSRDSWFPLFAKDAKKRDTRV